MNTTWPPTHAAILPQGLGEDDLAYAARLRVEMARHGVSRHFVSGKVRNRLRHTIEGLERASHSGRRLEKGVLRDIGVGRNSPCPCGSGKKFKHCCIGEAV